MPYVKINRELLPLSMKNFTDITTGGSYTTDYTKNLKAELRHVFQKYEGIFPSHNEDIKGDMVEIRYDYVFVSLISKDGKLLGFIGVDKNAR